MGAGGAVFVNAGTLVLSSVTIVKTRPSREDKAAARETVKTLAAGAVLEGMAERVTYLVALAAAGFLDVEGGEI